MDHGIGIKQFNFIELGVTTSEEVEEAVPGGSFIVTSYGYQAFYQVEPGVVSLQFEYQNNQFVVTRLEYYL